MSGIIAVAIKNTEVKIVPINPPKARWRDFP
jgi:hypothetical protein